MEMADNSPKTRIRGKLSSFQIIILGFAGVILLGAVLLMMPFSSKAGVFTPFNEALFTSTSAVCVTGLVVHDTAVYWSLFGQILILIMIQIGGLGVITVAASLVLISGRRISLMQRSTMQEAIAAPDMAGIVSLTRFIVISTFVLEALGAVAMMPVFCMDYGPKGIWLAVFHSVSAFCNAGFDIMGTPEAPYQSLTSYASNPFICIPVIFLIISGGIGFLTWQDVRTNKFRIRRYRLQSKVILTITVFLIFIPGIYFFFVDFANHPLGERILISLFQAVTPRTAGFNTADLNMISPGSRGIIIILMLIGGSPGSTAGGMKTTTFAVLLIHTLTIFRRKKESSAFGRRIEESAVRNASAILIMYLLLFFTGAVILSTSEGFSFGTSLFETASAVGTVGLTLGITPSLGIVSQIVLIILMFLGRVGGLTLIYAALSRPDIQNSKLPQEKIAVG